MKKAIVAIAVILPVLFVILVAAMVGVFTLVDEPGKLKLNDINLLVNMDSYLYEECTYEEHILRVDFDPTEDGWKGQEINGYMAQYLDDGCFAIIKKASPEFELFVLSSDNQRINSIALQEIPDEMLSYNGGILLKLNDRLYFWDYNSTAGLEEIYPESFSQECQLKVHKNLFAYTNGNNIYLYDSEGTQIKRFKKNATLIGFLDEKTLLFTKDFDLFLGVVYRYNVESGLISELKPIFLPSDMHYSTISSDKKYLLTMCLTDSGCWHSYIYDLESFERKVVFEDFPTEYIKSIQWVG